MGTALHPVPRTSLPRGPSLLSMLAPLEERVGKVKHLHGQKLIYRNHLTDPHYLHRFHFHGPEGGDSYQRLGLFAGIHGDEVAGSLAAVRFLTELVERPELAQGMNSLSILSVIQPGMPMAPVTVALASI